VDAKETPVESAAPGSGRSGERAPGAEWFARWFGEDYKRLYPHRDVAQAAEQVAALLRAAEGFLPPARGERAFLDVGCGAGRHLRALRARGLAAFGIDLSPVLLRDARSAGCPVARADMRRLPFADERFDLVACFFTTFGYFDSHAEDEAFLRELRRVVRPSGLLFLDLPNAPVVRRGLVPFEQVEAGALRAEVSRFLEGDRVIKRIRIFRDGGEEIHEERVRLYEEADMGAMLGRTGLEILASFGDERGGSFDAERSPRMSLLLRRMA